MNKLRFRSGQVHLRRVRVEAVTRIDAGDLLWLDGNVARPASDFTWDTDLPTTQNAFAAKFLGVAHQSSALGETTPVSVDVSADSVYEFDCNPAGYELGTPLGVDENSSELMNQQLESALRQNAIARAAEFAIGTVSSLRVTFASALTTSSANVNASVG